MLRKKGSVSSGSKLLLASAPARGWVRTASDVADLYDEGKVDLKSGINID